MKTIFIRTNYGGKVGLGHLFRMKKFANIIDRKKKIIFILDKYNKIIPHILKFECIFLYNKNKKFVSQNDDAIKVKSILKKYEAELLIVDDYRLNLVWENHFYKKIKLIVFDDNNKKRHKCDYLVDSKWDSEKTYKRYDKLLNKNAIKILGPQYSLIDKKNQKISKKNQQFNILFYLGGGGNFKGFDNFFLNLINQFKGKKIKIILVKGPFAENYKKIFLSLKNNTNVQIEKDNYNLNKILPITDLYIGVSSSIIYDLNYYNIPSILFSISKNQENSLKSLGELGFYFLLKNKDFLIRYKNIVKFINLIFNNYLKIKNLNKKKIQIDSKGGERIKNIIFKKKKLKYYNLNILKKSKIKKNGIYKVLDNQINLYLLNRNLNINRKNSANQKKINNLDHYLWWFSEKKKLFYYLRDDQIRLFFYHKIIKLNSSKFYYGGWFKTKNSTIFSDVMTVIKWQISRFKKYKWIAIIRKENLFVKKANLYLGFKLIKFDEKYSKHFNNLNKLKFNILLK